MKITREQIKDIIKEVFLFKENVIKEAYGNPIGSGDPAQEIISWAQEGNRVTVDGKNIWPGLGSRAGLHSYADEMIRDKWQKSGSRFIKKVDNLPAGTEVELKRFQSTTRGRGKWVVAGTVVTSDAVQTDLAKSELPNGKRMQEIYELLGFIYERDIGKSHVSNVSLYSNTDAPFSGKNWKIVMKSGDEMLFPDKDTGEYASKEPAWSEHPGQWEILALF